MLDAATSILTVAAKGKPGEAYNISNPTSVISIKEMAELITAYAGTKLQFAGASSDDKILFNPMDNSSLKSKKIQMLDWNGLFDAPTGFEHTVEIIRESCE